MRHVCCPPRGGCRFRPLLTRDPLLNCLTERNTATGPTLHRMREAALALLTALTPSRSLVLQMCIKQGPPPLVLATTRADLGAVRFHAPNTKICVEPQGKLSQN